MSPLFDFKCETCGTVRKDVLQVHHSGHQEIMEEWPRCCGELMDKQWPRTSFKVKGFNAQNGYSDGDV